MSEPPHTPQQRPSFSVWGLWGQACRGLSGHSAGSEPRPSPVQVRGDSSGGDWWLSGACRELSFPSKPWEPWPAAFLSSPQPCRSAFLGGPLQGTEGGHCAVCGVRHGPRPPTGDREPVQGCCWVSPRTPARPPGPSGPQGNAESGPCVSPRDGLLLSPTPSQSGEEMGAGGGSHSPAPPQPHPPSVVSSVPRASRSGEPSHAGAQH